MLELVVTAIIILTLCLMLHYYQHFRLKHCAPQLLSKQQQCCFVFMSLDTELNLFPQCFIMYILFILCLCISVIIKMNCNYMLDWTLIYGVLIVCLIESFFSFYQYKIIMHSPTIPSTNVKSYIFIIYCFLFSGIFVIQIHFVYWAWPILILFHLIFNTLCALKFSSHLIAQYSNFDYNILSSIYLMKWILIFGAILQCIYLTLFTIVSNINLLYYYLPLFWSASTLLFSINFIKNRYFIKHNLFKVYQCCKHSKAAQYIQEKNDQQIFNQQEFINYHHKQYQLSMNAQHRMEMAIQNEQTKQDPPTNGQQASTQKQFIEHKQNNQTQQQQPSINTEQNGVAENKQDSTLLTPNNLTPNIMEETKIDLPKLPLFRSSNTVGSATYYTEEKEMNRQSVIYGVNKYKAMDLLGLTPKPNRSLSPSGSLKKIKLNIAQSLSLHTSKSASYIGMNEEEKLDIADAHMYRPKLQDISSTKTHRLRKHISRIGLKMKRQNSVPFLKSNSSPIATEMKKDITIQNDDSESKISLKKQQTMPDVLSPKLQIRVSQLKKQKTSPNLITGTMRIMAVTPNLSSTHSFGSVFSKTRHKNKHSKTRTVHFQETKSESDEEDGVNDGFVFYEEQNEEEDIDFDVEEMTFENNDVDGEVLDEINNEHKEDETQVEVPILDNMQSMHSLIGLGLMHYNSVSELKQLALYQQQNSHIYE